RTWNNNQTNAWRHMLVADDLSRALKVFIHARSTGSEIGVIDGNAFGTLNIHCLVWRSGQGNLRTQFGHVESDRVFKAGVAVAFKPGIISRHPVRRDWRK